MKAKVVICGDTSRIDSFLTTMIMKDPSVAGIVLPVESETENSDTALSALVTAAHLCQQFSLTVGKKRRSCQCRRCCDCAGTATNCG